MTTHLDLTIFWSCAAHFCLFVTHNRRFFTWWITYCNTSKVMHQFYTKKMVYISLKLAFNFSISALHMSKAWLAKVWISEQTCPAHVWISYFSITINSVHILFIWFYYWKFIASVRILHLIWSYTYQSIPKTNRVIYNVHTKIFQMVYNMISYLMQWY